MNALANHLYLIIRYINLSFNYFCNFYRIIESNNPFTNHSMESVMKALLEYYFNK